MPCFLIGLECVLACTTTCHWYVMHADRIVVLSMNLCIDFDYYKKTIETLLDTGLLIISRRWLVGLVRLFLACKRYLPTFDLCVCRFLDVRIPASSVPFLLTFCIEWTLRKRDHCVSCCYDLFCAFGCRHDNEQY